MRKTISILAILILALFAGESVAREVTIFGPQKYTRKSGSSDAFTGQFRAVSGQGMVLVKNGYRDGSNRIMDSISSAGVYINGVQIFGPSDFNKKVYLLEASVDLEKINTVSVNLASSPGSYITIEIKEDIDQPGISFNASSTSIPQGDSSVLTWSSTSATSCTIEPGIGAVDPAGSVTITPAATTTYTITAAGPGGTSSAVLTIEVAPPPTVTIQADPPSVINGESTVLTWEAENAATCLIEPGIGEVDSRGSVAVASTLTTVYTITATGVFESAQDTAQAIVYDPPLVSMTASPGEIIRGESTTLSWESANADLCTITPDIGIVATTGYISVSPDKTTTYTITAQGAGGTAASTVTLLVMESNTPPQVNFTEPSVTIEKGSRVDLSWSSQHATTVQIDNNIGSVGLNGSQTVSPQATTTYTVVAVSSGGISSDRVTVYVNGAPAPLPEGSFGNIYKDLIPADTTIDEYDSKRFALITGFVNDMDDQPIQGATVTIHHHPEYGTVVTDESGRYTLPVEGGGILTLQFTKPGFITSHRQVLTPWNDSAVCDTVQLIAQDSKSTVIAFNGNPETKMVHNSTPVSDEFGIRSATLIFSGDNRAFLMDAKGNDINELTTITVRATEFETPDTMPAVLPPTSAYTYCVELQADGADRIRFEKPVPFWVDNFLGFDVGEIVPVGYYDRDRAVWVPSENGVVVQLLDTDRDGITDALDADGDGQADDLDSNGSFKNEVAGLDDPTRYPPNATFWRSEIRHFTPWDCNWPYGPPLDAIPPNTLGMPAADIQNEKQKDCNETTGSFVEERSRIFHENIAITGTDLALHYASNRVKGYKTMISVPASGEEVPESLKQIIVKVQVAGRTLERVLDPLPNQKAEFIWDGLDQMEKRVAVSITAQVSVGFVYGAVYLTPNTFGRAFAKAGDNITGIRARQEVVSWLHNKIPLPKTEKLFGLAQGWALSTHHLLSRSDPSILYTGDGKVIRNKGMIIDTVAGNGNAGYSGDGGSATDAEIWGAGIAVDHTGNIYIAGIGDSRIRKVDTSGIITTVAGNGMEGNSGDGGPATEARLSRPVGVTVDDMGNIYIVDGHYNQCIRKVDTSGTITTIAGNGNQGYSGDGGPATEATLNSPSEVAVDAAGNIYIADGNNNRIRKVDPSGIITTVAGNGDQGYSGDGGPATNARLYFPTGVAVDTAGNIYIADIQNNAIRKVDTSGIITTVAGNGSYGYSGDGGPATEAALNWPRKVAVDTAGNIYISEQFNMCVRKVNTSGIITTVAGNGNAGYSGDGGPATEANLNRPHGIAVDDDGFLYINDKKNSRIRKVAWPAAFITNMVYGDILFVEKNGLAHIINRTGLHKTTIDSDTGVALYTFGYNNENDLISITDQFGSRTTVQRDENGLPIAVVSPDGIITTLTIDADGNLSRITYPDDSYHAFEYTVDGLLTAKVEPEGNRFEHVFDSAGKLTDAVNSEGGHWHYTRTVYENGDVLTEAVTGEGNLTTYLDSTDSTGAYASIITDPTGGETIFSQSSNGLTANKTLACGMDLEFKYDIDPEYKFKFIQQVTESTPDNLIRTTTRDKRYEDTDADKIPDLITETVSINGNSTTRANNVLLSQKNITSPEGRRTTLQYNPDTLITESVSVSGLFDTNFGYDEKGRLVSIDTQNRRTDFTYDTQGFLKTATDGENHTTSYLYDAVGRITQVTRPDTTSLWLDYDDNGNLTVLTNPSTVDHSFVFNKVNLESRYNTPLSGSYAYTYDKDRRLTQELFPSGESINLVYDNTRLSQLQTPEGTIDYTYDCSNKIDTITKDLESINYTWDGKLLTSETITGQLSKTIDYFYNDDFNLVTMGYAGETITFTYDTDSFLTGAGNFTINRNTQNGLPESVFGGNLNLARTFNGFGEIEAQTAAVNGSNLVAWNLIRDNNGRITQRTQTVNSITSTHDYIYDSMGRLLTVTRDGILAEEYQYGINGSRVYEMNAARGITGRALNYSDEDHLLSAGNVYYSYNLDGFLSTQTQDADVTLYDYTARGELLSVSLPDNTLIEYVHDPLGRRITKKINGIILEKYLWQGLTTLLAVYDGSGNLLQRFEYADQRMPVAMKADGVTYYLVYDQVGSLSVVADESGNVVKQIEYDTFGNIIRDSNLGFEIPFGFAGGLHDRHTGLVRFGYRDYDPATGRWTAKDPIFFAGGDTDLYGYVLNDPVNNIDPLGLFDAGTMSPLSGMMSANYKSPGPARKIPNYFRPNVEGVSDYVNWYIDQSDIEGWVNNPHWWAPPNWTDTAIWWVASPVMYWLDPNYDFFDPWGKNRYSDLYSSLDPCE